VNARATARVGVRVGSQVGSYRIVDELGGGGMGRVFVAEHLLLGRRAAVKVLLPHLTHVPEIVQRFFNEARATTRIRHPGIVEIYDFGYTDDNHAYLVMELLDGLSLGDRLLSARKLPVATALVLARRIAAALAAAHDCGVVHRDLKPDNVFLVRDAEGGAVEQVKLLDFGIAKLVHDGLAAASMTTSGVVMGTPLYMSPEQCRGASECDPRSDLYSLGCVVYEMIAGRPPFYGQGGGEVIAAHLHAPVPSLRRADPSVPAAVDALVQRLLAKDPGARPASAAALVAELDGLLDVLAPRRSAMQPATVLAPSAPLPPKRRRGIAGLGLALLGIAAVAIGLAIAGDERDVAAPPPAPPPPRKPRTPTVPPMPPEREIVAVPPDAGIPDAAVADAAPARDMNPGPTRPTRTHKRRAAVDAGVEPPPRGVDTTVGDGTGVTRLVPP
jgi:serine/threonine-protein kinase